MEGPATARAVPPPRRSTAGETAVRFQGAPTVIVDAWIQHPTLRFAADWMFEPFRRWNHRRDRA
jgi:hypothetical protein